ncbi:MAG: Ig-like domain-containing protein, partial [Candidatus Krumholzibacteria bacterium]|nr:Ig-like domain-containing protein [Candidatus Krumholzibacteria bacterium]
GWIEWEGLKMIIYHSSFPSDSLITVTVNTTATDLAGNHLEAACIFSYRTSIDNTSPRLVSASPSNGATGVPTSITQIVLNFSEPMDQTSFDYMPAENIDARIMREIVSEPEFSPDFSSLTVPLSGNLLSGCTYWVEFLDVTDGAGNYIDPRPTSYSFTTSGNVTCFPVKNEYCWYYIDNELTQFTRCIENYNQSSGTFDEVKYEGGLKDEAEHLRKTSSEILHLGFSEYDDYGVLEQTIMWDDPLPYIKFPLENYLPSSWNFSTQTSAGPYTMYVNGTAGIDNKEDLIIDTDYIEGTFKDCYVHHLHVMVEIDSSGVNIGGFDHHQWMWLAPGAGPVRIITEDTENGEGPYVDTLTVYDWDL